MIRSAAARRRSRMGYGHSLKFARDAIEDAKQKAKSWQSSPTAIAPSSPPPLHYNCWQLPGWTAPRSPQRAKTANAMGSSSPRGGYVETTNVKGSNKEAMRKATHSGLPPTNFIVVDPLLEERSNPSYRTLHGKLTATSPRAGAPTCNERSPPAKAATTLNC